MAETKEHVLTHPFSQIIYKMHLILLVARTMMENGADSDRTSQYIMRSAGSMTMARCSPAPTCGNCVRRRCSNWPG